MINVKRQLRLTRSVVFSARTMKCWENAKSETFYARDNVSNFINWTKMIGVRDACSFETEDLVLHNNQKNVVLCLLEVARIACNKYNFIPSPGLVQFEREIDQEIERDALNKDEYSTNEKSLISNAESGVCSMDLCKENVSNGDAESDHWSSVSRDNFGRTPSVTSISSTSVGSSIETSVPGDSQVTLKPTSQLDQKVSGKENRRSTGQMSTEGD